MCDTVTVSVTVRLCELPYPGQNLDEGHCQASRDPLNSFSSSSDNSNPIHELWSSENVGHAEYSEYAKAYIPCILCKIRRYILHMHKSVLVYTINFEAL